MIRGVLHREYVRSRNIDEKHNEQQGSCTLGQHDGFNACRSCDGNQGTANR